MKKVFFVCFVVLLLAGCARGLASSPDSPFCAPPVTLGDHMNEVKEMWGEPDEINKLGYDEMGLKKEEWIYRSEGSDVPVGHAFVCVTHQLVFTDKQLTSINTYEDEKIKRKK